MDCCLDYFRCTSRNSNRDLKMFDSEPLVSASTNVRPQPYTRTTPELVASLLYEFVRHELTTSEKQRQTHFLGSDLSDEFSCLLCNTKKHTKYIQFEIDNRFFNNISASLTRPLWAGNQYIIQYVCFPCSQRIQSHLVKTIKRTEHDVRTMRFLLLLHKLSEHPSPVSGLYPHLITRILSFLPAQVLTMKAITYHRNPRQSYQKSQVEDDLSIWVQEKVIR